MDVGEGKMEMVDEGGGEGAGDAHWRSGNGVRRRWKRWMLERKRWKLWREEMEKVDVGKVKMVDEGDGEEPGDGCWRGGNGGKRR